MSSAWIMVWLVLSMLLWPVSGWAIGTEFTDNFTGTDETNCTAHTSDSGHSWTELWVDGSAFGRCKIRSNQGGSNFADSAAIGLYGMTNTPTGREYAVQGTGHFDENTDRTLYLGCRLTGSGSTFTGYVVELRETGATGNDLRLFKVSGGNVTSLVESDVEGGDDGEVFKLECRDATKKLFINGVERLSSTNNEITDVGVGGIGWGDIATNNGGTGDAANANWDVVTLTTLASTRRPVAPMVLP